MMVTVIVVVVRPAAARKKEQCIRQWRTIPNKRVCKWVIGNSNIMQWEFNFFFFFNEINFRVNFRNMLIINDVFDDAQVWC